MALLVVSLLNLNAGLKGAAELSFIDRVVMRVSAPAQAAMSWVVEGIGDAWFGYIYLVGLREENAALLAEVEDLRAEVLRLQEERLENRRLRRLFDIRLDERDLEMVGARVVAVGTAQFYRSVRIDAGSNRGIKAGLAVVAADGVVGRVLSVSGEYADVLLLIDANSAVDVVVQRTRARGSVKGLGEPDSVRCRIDYLNRTDDVKSGDIMVTSGLGGIFPPGLKVGTVAEVDQPPYGLYQGATLNPTANFSRLEEVAVITGEKRREADGQN